MAETKSDTLVCMGVISGVHGIKGEVLIKSFTEVLEDIGSYGPLFNEAGDKEFVLKDIRVAKKGVVAKVKGVRYRDEAEALKGTELFVPRDVLPEDDDEDSFYHIDLIGLPVFHIDGSEFGKILAVPNFGAGDLLEVKLSETGKTVFVPFNKECVPEIDISGRRVVVDPPELVEMDLGQDGASGE